MEWLAWFKNYGNGLQYVLLFLQLMEVVKQVKPYRTAEVFEPRLPNQPCSESCEDVENRPGEASCDSHYSKAQLGQFCVH